MLETEPEVGMVGRGLHSKGEHALGPRLPGCGGLARPPRGSACPPRRPRSPAPTCGPTRPRSCASSPRSCPCPTWRATPRTSAATPSTSAGCSRSRGLTVALLDGAGGPPARLRREAHGRGEANPGDLRALRRPARRRVAVDEPALRPRSPRRGPARGGKPIDLATLAGPAPAEACIYARSAGDDKAPIQALLARPRRARRRPASPSR